MNNEYFRSNEENKFPEYKPFLAEQYRPKSEIGEKTNELTDIPEENNDQAPLHDKKPDNKTNKDIIDKMTKGPATTMTATTSVATSGAALSMVAVVGAVAVGGALAAVPINPGKSELTTFDVGADYLYYSFVIEDKLDTLDYFVEISDNTGAGQVYEIVNSEKEDLVTDLQPATDYKFEIFGVEIPNEHSQHETENPPAEMPEEKIVEHTVLTKDFTTLSDTSTKVLMKYMEPVDNGTGGFDLPFNLFVSDYNNSYGGFKIRLLLEDMFVRDYFLELKGEYSDVITNLKRGTYKFEIYGFGENGQEKIAEETYVSEVGNAVKGATAQFRTINIGCDFIKYSVDLNGVTDGYEYNLNIESYNLNQSIPLTEGNLTDYLAYLMADNEYFVSIVMSKGEEKYLLYEGDFKTTLSTNSVVLMDIVQTEVYNKNITNLYYTMMVSDYDNMYYSYKVLSYYEGTLINEEYYDYAGVSKGVVQDARKGEYKFEVYGESNTEDVLLNTFSFNCTSKNELVAPIVYSVDVNKEYNTISIYGNNIVKPGMKTVVKNELTGDVVDLAAFNGTAIPDVVTEYSYYWVDGTNTISSEINKFTVDPTVVAGHYVFNSVNPSDILKTFNSDGTFNVYIDVKFSSEDKDLYYQIEYNDINGRQFLHSTSPVAVMENIVNEFSLVYEIQKTIGIVDYIFQQTAVSGTTAEDWTDSYFEHTMITKDADGNFNLNLVVTNNVVLGDGGYILTPDGERIDFSNSNFVYSNELNANSQIIKLSGRLDRFELYIEGSTFADKYEYMENYIREMNLPIKIKGDKFMTYYYQYIDIM